MYGLILSLSNPCESSSLYQVRKQPQENTRADWLNIVFLNIKQLDYGLENER